MAALYQILSLLFMPELFIIGHLFNVIEFLFNLFSMC